LIDVVEPSESFSVGLFLDMASAAIERIRSDDKGVVAVGGTALYIKALLYGLFEGPGSEEEIRSHLLAQVESDGLAQLYRELESIDPAAAENIHPNDTKRIIRALEVYRITGKPISSLQQQWEKGETRHDWTIIGLRREKADASRRINRRVKRMIEAGLVDEVRSLLAEDRPVGKQARQAIGYAEIIRHLEGHIKLEEAVELIKKNTRRLAKNQRTWFKTFKNVHWLDIGSDETTEQILGRIRALLKAVGAGDMLQ